MKRRNQYSSSVHRVDCLRDEHSSAQDCALPCMVLATVGCWLMLTLAPAPAPAQNLETHHPLFRVSAAHAERLEAALTKESPHDDRTWTDRLLSSANQS
eukprot:COSAG02_NODE_4271_length_5563_cov_3.829063_5_plen_99_part_00